MRLNKYLARHTGLSRREADELISQGRVTVNGAAAQLGTQVEETAQVTLDGRPVTATATRTVMLHKPAGFVCSRRAQGDAQTIYELLPQQLRGLKSIGRLDKDSSGLLLLSNDGQLAHDLMHPSKRKEKRYRVVLDRPLAPQDRQQIEQGVKLEDGLSSLALEGEGKAWTVTMHEGRNRQIRRTFAAAGYTVTELHRFKLGPYELDGLPEGEWRDIPTA